MSVTQFKPKILIILAYYLWDALHTLVIACTHSVSRNLGQHGTWTPAVLINQPLYTHVVAPLDQENTTQHF